MWKVCKNLVSLLVGNLVSCHLLAFGMSKVWCTTFQNTLIHYILDWQYSLNSGMAIFTKVWFWILHFYDVQLSWLYLFTKFLFTKVWFTKVWMYNFLVQVKWLDSWNSDVWKSVTPLKSVELWCHSRSFSSADGTSASQTAGKMWGKRLILSLAPQ